MPLTSQVRSQLRENTAMVWVETPTNPLLRLVDLARLVEMIRAEKGQRCLICCDNTFATAWNQQPLSFGADLVMLSASKYIGGHSDMTGGALITSNAELATRQGLQDAIRSYLDLLSALILALETMQSYLSGAVRYDRWDVELLRLSALAKAVGSIASPFEAYLALRGMKTLALRMERQCRNAQKVAEYLECHEKVVEVHYPGLASHPQHALCQRQMRSGGAVVTVRLKGRARRE